jgi:uncharacterized protein
MKLLFYFGHPAQYHFLKFPIKELRKKGYQITLVIKTKDVLESLLKDDKEEYINILPEGRQKSKISILFGLIKRDFRLFRYACKKKFNLFIGTDPSLSHVGFLLNIPVITVLEDDLEVIPLLAKLTYPFTSHIVTPANVRVGKYEYKKISYSGYMKLAYLHPNYFTKVQTDIKKPYFLLRLSQLNAHHDFGINGINEDLLDQIIGILSKSGNLYISSEKSLSPKYDLYHLRINPSEMHQYLANASMLISDSQSMSMEAAMLGIPSIRFSDFAGKISVLEELEHTWQLTFGISPREPQRLIMLLNELINEPELSEKFQLRRKKMLSEKIDVTAFMVWFIENYPESVKIMKDDPKYQFRFK